MQDVAPGITGLPQLPEAGQDAERPPDRDADHRPGQVSGVRHVQHRHAAEHRRPGDERMARAAHDLRLAARWAGRNFASLRATRGLAAPGGGGQRRRFGRPPPRGPRTGGRRAARPVRCRAPRFQGPAQPVRGWPAALRLLFEAAHDARGQVLGAVGPLLHDHRRRLGDVFHQDAGDRRRAERQLADEHLVAHDAQAINVRTAVDLPVAGRLLGAHEVRCPDRHAGGRQRSAGGRGQRLGDAEIRHDDPAAAALEEDVVGLHVAVDDADGVGGAQGIRRLGQDAPHFLRREAAPALEARRQRLAVHVGHDEVHDPVRPFADGVNRHDVGVGEPRRRFGFAEEPRPDAFLERQLRRQYLDCHAALQALVAGVIDDPHAAAPDLPLDGVAGPEGLGQACDE